MSTSRPTCCLGCSSGRATLDWENDPDVDLGPHCDVIAALLSPIHSDVLIQ